MKSNVEIQFTCQPDTLPAACVEQFMDEMKSHVQRLITMAHTEQFRASTIREGKVAQGKVLALQAVLDFLLMTKVETRQ